MTRGTRLAVYALGGLLVVVAGLLLYLYARFGGGGEFPNRSGTPSLDASALEEVAALPTPPGNIAVSAGGRVFFTLHPEAGPEMAIVEWRDGHIVPFPNADFQPTGSHPLKFQNMLPVRIDRQGRLWTLDNALHGTGQPRILAFDIASGDLVYHHDFPKAIAGLGSHLNDLQIDPAGELIYIADASIFAQTPAVIVHDVRTGTSRRLLEKHESVEPEKFVPVVEGRRMSLFGLFDVRPGIDSIALDRSGEWLYFAAITAQHLYRARTADLANPALSADELANRVERLDLKTMSDGITTDNAGRVYLSDLEHNAIHRLTPGAGMETLLVDPRLRWPDGFGFGPDGWLYVTCSALHHVIGMSPKHTKANAPYHVYRFKPGAEGVPGH